MLPKKKSLNSNERRRGGGGGDTKRLNVVLNRHKSLHKFTCHERQVNSKDK